MKKVGEIAVFAAILGFMPLWFTALLVIWSIYGIGKILGALTK